VKFVFTVFLFLFLPISVCLAQAQSVASITPVATLSKGFSSASEPFLPEQPVASMPFLPNSDPFGTSLRVLSALFAVIIIALAISWFIQKKGGFGNNVFGKVIGVLPLDNRRVIYLVDVLGRVLVLGVTDSNINLLCEITDKDTIDSLRLEGETPGIPGMEKFFGFLKKSKKNPNQNNDISDFTSQDIKKNREKNQERLKKLNDLLIKRTNDQPPTEE
jgi:flagellar protein FliO/FliZ